MAEANPDYIYVDNSTKGVTNWFDDKDAADEEMTFDPGFFSIKDTINDILDNEEAAQILVNAFGSMTKMNVKATTLRMMGDNTMEKMAGMAPADGSLDKDKAMRITNAALQKIKK